MNNRSLIVIVTYNSAEFIGDCLESISSQTYKDWHLSIIDNNSSDDTVIHIREFRNRTSGFDKYNFDLARLKKNIGFAGGVNHAVFKVAAKRKNSYRYLVLINPDILLFPDALQNLLSGFDRQDTGAAGGLILDYDKNIIQHRGGRITGNFITYHEGEGEEFDDSGAGKAGTLREPDYVTGAFLATRFELFYACGGFDRGYRPLYFEELDYCLKLKQAGWKVITDETAVCRHYLGASVEKFSQGFYRYYHKNRIRCALLNMSLLKLIRIFVPAEFRWLKKSATGDQAGPLAYAYFINLVFSIFNLILKIKKYFILNRIELK